MDSGGISIISARALPTATATGVYNNPAFDDDIHGGNGITGSRSTPCIVTATANGNDAPASENNDKNSKLSSSDKGPRLHDDVTHTKRYASSVDFTMPEKEPRGRIRSVSSDGKPYRGMGKEELLRHSAKPLWRNLRYVCMSIVLTGWLALLITVVALVLTYPKCREAQDRAWWQKAVIYRVYVRSFLDAKGSDGVGDINGIRAKLDYIQSTGANTISLSPFYKLGKNATTDTHIVDHMDVDSQLGTLQELKLLVNETHDRGMHITVDFIPNHTSDEHPWFTKSREDPDLRQNEFRSFYIWTSGNEPINNWRSKHSGSAWQKEDLQHFYLHQFLPSQPDLNLRSGKVKEKLQEILIFWLDIGVDGFYIRDSDFLFEDYDLRDECLLANNTDKTLCIFHKGHPYSDYDHEFTRGLSQNFDILAHWRFLLDEYGNKSNRYRIMFADSTGSLDHVIDYYGLFNRDGVDFPLNTFNLNLNASVGGLSVAQMVSDWMEHIPSGRWSNWMGGDDRSPRLADRLGDKLAKTYLLLMMLLPGTPFMYYGDEIGLQGVPMMSKNPETEMMASMRSPMLWNSKPNNHDFCDQHCFKPWMNQSEATSSHTDEQGNIQEIKLDVESQRNNPDSIWNLFRNLTDLRKDNPSFVYGDYTSALTDDHVFSFVREFDGEKGYLIALNFHSSSTRKPLTGSHNTIPSSGTVELVSGLASGHSKGGSVSLDPLYLAAHEGIVVSWDYQAKEL